MNKPENGSNKVEQNGRAERTQIPRLLRGFLRAFQSVTRCMATTKKIECVPVMI